MTEPKKTEVNEVNNAQGNVLDSWGAFEKETFEILRKAKELDKEYDSYVSVPLFRGQRDSNWKLESTLDRIKKNGHVSSYHLDIDEAKSVIESYTDNEWNLRNWDEEVAEMERRANPSQELYAFMIYLRHNGFPSPLLDWTRSPYIAAFFAFNEAKSSNEYVAIFSYIEWAGQYKGWVGAEARISGMGPYVRAHRRHHLQQCRYTICTKKINGEICYTSHEDAFSLGKDTQDLLEKYIIPTSQRSEFLGRLDLMNIHSYSLFETEEGLSNHLANKAFVIKDFCV